MIRLGDINFGLGADTSRLRQSVDILARFGRQVDAVAGSSGNAARAVERQLRAQEKATVSALDKVLKLNQAMRQVSGSDQYILRANNAWRQLNLTMTSGVATQLQFQRAQERFNAQFSQASRSFKEYAAAVKAPLGANQEWINQLQNLSSTALLVAGPLSGIATRMVSISAIVKRGGVSLAAFVAGVAGGIYTINKFGGAVLRAGAEMKGFEAQFNAVTGSVTTGNAEIAKAIQIAAKTGTLITDVLPSFAKFEAASKGTNLEGERARMIFETMAAASAKLNLGTEQTIGIFRALEQMMSKGTVQAEELKGQLGDRLPGALRIAARAMGVTTSELAKMMQKGELITDDFLPKFARELSRTLNLGDNNVKSFTASWNRMQNSMFLLFADLDKRLQLTDRAMTVFDNIAKGLDIVRSNLDRLLPALGAVAGGLMGLAAPGLLTGLITLGKFISSATAAMWGFNAAVAANPLGGFAMLLTRIGLGAAGAYAGMKLIENGMQDSSLAMMDASTSADRWIDSTGRIIAAGNSTSVAMQTYGEALTVAEQITNRFADADTDLSAQFEANTNNFLAQIDRRIQGLMEQAQALNAMQSDPMVANAPEWAKSGADWILKQLGLPSREELHQINIGAIEEGIARLRKLREQITQTQVDAAKGDMAEPEDNVLTRTEEQIKKLAKAGEDIDDVIENIAALKRILAHEGEGLDAILKAEDLEEARKALKGLTESDLAELEKKLRDAGYAGANTMEALAQALTIQRELEDKLGKLKSKAGDAGNKRLGRQEDVLSDLERDIARVNAQIEDLENGTHNLDKLEKIWDREDKVERYADKLRNAGIAAEQAAQMTDTYAERLEYLDMLLEKMKGPEAFRDKLISAYDDAASALTDLALDGELTFEKFGDVVIGVLKDIAKEFIMLSIMNPLKNALFGTSSPTITADSALGVLMGLGRSSGAPASNSGGRVASAWGQFGAGDEALDLRGMSRVSTPAVERRALEPIADAVTNRINEGFGVFDQQIQNRVNQGFGAFDTSAIRGKANYMKPGMGFGDPRSADFAQNYLQQVQLASGKSFTVHKDAAASFKGFFDELEASGYNIDSIAGYNFRNKVGRNSLSQHAWGNAVDINPAENPFLKGYGRDVVTDLPPNVSEMAARHGLSWGGDWKSAKDAMHFEWTGAGGGSAGATQALTQLAEKSNELADTFGSDMIPSMDKFTKGIDLAAVEVPKTLADTSGVLGSTVGSAAGTLETGLGGIFSKLGSGLDSMFSGLGGVLQNIASGLGGGGGAGGGFGNIFSSIIGALFGNPASPFGTPGYVPIYHNGGTVGESSYSAPLIRSRVNEELLLAEKGERILTRKDAKKIGSALSTVGLTALADAYDMPHARKGSLLTKATPVIGGEAGTEAIMPLGRDSSGNLGVKGIGGSSDEGPQVEVNIVTPPGTTAKTTQQNKGGKLQLGVIIQQIKDEITNDLAQGGTGLNKAMEGRYGLNPAVGVTK